MFLFNVAQIVEIVIRIAEVNYDLPGYEYCYTTMNSGEL